MDHFKGISETERYNNEVLNQLRRTNELLEQLALLLKPKDEPKRPQTRGGGK